MSEEELKKEEMTKMYNKIKEAQAALNEACKIADENSFSFGWDLAYGMGGYYEGKGTKSFRNSVRKEGEWVSSSENC